MPSAPDPSAALAGAPDGASGGVESPDAETEIRADADSIEVTDTAATIRIDPKLGEADRRQLLALLREMRVDGPSLPDRRLRLTEVTSDSAADDLTPNDAPPVLADAARTLTRPAPGPTRAGRGRRRRITGQHPGGREVKPVALSAVAAMAAAAVGCASHNVGAKQIETAPRAVPAFSAVPVTSSAPSPLTHIATKYGAPQDLQVGMDIMTGLWNGTPTGDYPPTCILTRFLDYPPVHQIDRIPDMLMSNHNQPMQYRIAPGGTIEVGGNCVWDRIGP